MSEIVLLANARVPSRRAQSLQVMQMAAALARAGRETTLLHARRHEVPGLPGDQDLFDYYAIAAGPRAQVESVPCIDWIDRTPRRLQAAPGRLQELSFARRAAAAVRARHPDALVYCREIEAARSLVRDKDRRVFLELHRVPGGRLRRRWLLQTAPACAGVVAISRGVAEDLVALGLSRERMITEPDAYDPGRFETLPTREDARLELGLDGDAEVVVYTGGLMSWKGVDLLIESARAMPGVQFLIAGGMEADVQRLRLAIGDLPGVRLEGFQPPARVPLYLAAADVGVIPNRSTPAISARHTSPLKAFEAMAAGLALVASDLPSLRDALGDEGAVFVPPDDAQALASGLAQLLGDARLRGALAARGRERAVDHTWDARAARLLEWMEGA